jgi:hypothetical protein
LLNNVPRRKGNENANESASGFNKAEWLQKAREIIMQREWGSGILWSNGPLVVELVRVGTTEDIMVRIRTGNVRNALKLTKREHIVALLELAKAIVNNEKHLADKLEAIKEVLRPGAIRQEGEI